MFRIPSIIEILSLFIRPRSVERATAAITRAVENLGEVQEHHETVFARHDEERARLEEQVKDKVKLMDEAAAEAERAGRIAKRFKELLA